MKFMYGLIVLFISNLATFFLMWQIFLNEENSIIKYLFLLILLLGLLIIDFKSLLTFTKKIKKGLPPERKAKAIKKIRKKKRITSILLTFLSFTLIAGNYLYYIANQTISTITLTLEPAEFESYIIVPKDSNIQSMDDSNLIYIGFDQSQEQYQSLFEDVLDENYDKVAYVHYQPFFYESNELLDRLFDGEIHAIYITQSTYDAYKQQDETFEDSVRILKTHTIRTSVAPKSVDVSKQAFNVLIVGVDIREDQGDIHTPTRADTIMIASFNPKTMKASLISIPRDTYVPLSHNGEYDKLTHAGSYGMGCLIETIEDFLDIDIHYYAKFNFKALVGLVDALGGIEVDVKFSFSESNSDDVANSIHVSEGLQILNGEEALAYARHRKTQNDHVRNNSQQEVLKAILKKLVSFDSVTKINGLLNVLNTNMTTNIGRDEILSFIILAPRLGELEITTYVIEGDDYLTYVPKYDEELWITELSESSIETAQNMINTIFEGE